MLKVRLIPILLLKNGQLVRSEDFSIHQIIGDPVHEVERFNEWNVDELIYLDITKGAYNFQQRTDHKTKHLGDNLEILDAVSKTCFMPLTWGGGIKTLNDASLRLSRGADKVSLNQVLHNSPELITQIAKKFGSQAVVASIDAFKHEDGHYSVFTDGKNTDTSIHPAEWARRAEDLGCGEILLQSINRDGAGTGYDLELINQVCNAVQIPVIACSGVGMYEHYAMAVKAGASAVAAANIWHFKELSDRNGKRAMLRAKLNVRQ